MPVQPVSPVILSCHPDSRGAAVSGVKAFLHFEGIDLAVRYVVSGDIERVRVPATKPPRRMPRLWQHTCLEAFIATGASAGYCELNFSLSGEWTAYCYRGYRDGEPLENDRLEPGISVRRQQNTLELTAYIRLDHVPGVPRHGGLRLGLAAVIEENDGGLSYWALRHAPGKPDFHFQDSFILHFTR
jgi:hypothetical protein